MKLGLIGLGRMGANMARRLRRGGIDVVAYNRNPDVTRALAAETGLTAVESLPELVAALAPPRTVWLMLPAGDITDTHLEQLQPLLARGDLVVDGANSWYKDSLRRAAQLNAVGIDFADAGVSGGVWGLENGYALMLGGSAAAIARLKPAIQVLAPGADSRLAALRAGRQRPLREDGPQRHRVRHDAGLSPKASH